MRGMRVARRFDARSTEQAQVQRHRRSLRGRSTAITAQAALVDSAYGLALTMVRDGPAKAAGIATGQAAARATLQRRQGDGADAATQPV